MKENDTVIYTISISGVKNLVNQEAIVRELPKLIGSGKMNVTPATPKTPGMIDVPRLFTSWRGDASEQAWQQSVMEIAKEHGASIAIDVQPWSHATGYPKGDLAL